MNLITCQRVFTAIFIFKTVFIRNTNRAKQVISFQNTVYKNQLSLRYLYDAAKERDNVITHGFSRGFLMQFRNWFTGIETLRVKHPSLVTTQDTRLPFTSLENNFLYGTSENRMPKWRHSTTVSLKFIG